MSVNKNAMIRYLALDRCLGNPGRTFYIEDLVEACNAALLDLDPASTGVKKRQVQYDMNFMQSSQGWLAPIESHRDGKRVFYRYSDTSFSINNRLLNESEVHKLVSAVDILSRFKGMPQFEWLYEIIPKIGTAFNLRPGKGDCISFDANPYLRGIEYLDDLFLAIVNEQVLLIDYQPFYEEKPAGYNIHPYYLKQYNNRWFLFGWNEEMGKVTNFPLDRIRRVKEERKPFRKNSSIDFNEYFEDIIGVTHDERAEPVRIRMKIDPLRAPYVLTKPLHGSQINGVLDTTGLEISLQLIPNNEFYQQVLSFGDHLVVLEPREIRLKVREILERALGKYGEGIA